MFKQQNKWFFGVRSNMQVKTEKDIVFYLIYYIDQFKVPHIQIQKSAAGNKRQPVFFELLMQIKFGHTE